MKCAGEFANALTDMGRRASKLRAAHWPHYASARMYFTKSQPTNRLYGTKTFESVLVTHRALVVTKTN